MRKLMSHLFIPLDGWSTPRTASCARIATPFPGPDAGDHRPEATFNLNRRIWQYDRDYDHCVRDKDRDDTGLAHRALCEKPSFLANSIAAVSEFLRLFG
jgi:hypothetical protein